jgi:hypothetical protein
MTTRMYEPLSEAQKIPDILALATKVHSLLVGKMFELSAKRKEQPESMPQSRLVRKPSTTPFQGLDLLQANPKRDCPIVPGPTGIHVPSVDSVKITSPLAMLSPKNDCASIRDRSCLQSYCR